MAQTHYVRIDGTISSYNRARRVYQKVRTQRNKIVNSIPKFANEENMALARFVQKSAKLRAPRSPMGVKSRGELANSIKARSRGKSYIVVEATAPYAGFQEFGFKPHKVSPYLHPKLFEWYFQKTGERPPAVITVSKYKPFMGPALEKGLKRIPRMVDNVIENSAKAGGYRKTG